MNVLGMLRAPSLLVLLLIPGLASCGGGQFGSICEQQQQCSGGNDLDVDACIAQGNAASNIAAAYDCGEQFAKAADCVEAKGTCDDGRFTADCGDEQEALGRCQAAASDGKGGDF